MVIFECSPVVVLHMSTGRKDIQKMTTKIKSIRIEFNRSVDIVSFCAGVLVAFLAITIIIRIADCTTNTTEIQCKKCGKYFEIR